MEHRVNRRITWNRDQGYAPATVYFVHRLDIARFRKAQLMILTRAYSETKAAFPNTVSSTIRYKSVPQNQ